ncbi:MAG: DUF3347 domain-containing protein, partial [Verrucomicrobia bacterium]
ETATDPAPMEMFETVIQLKPPGEWRKVAESRWYSSWAPEFLQKPLRKIWPDVRPISWDELVSEMDAALQIPGQVNAWTMPIKTRIDMLSTGIRTPVGIKVFGNDLGEISKLGEHLESVLRDVPGTRSVYAERTTGGYYLDIIPNRREIARYGLNVEDVLMVVETAIGGMPVAKTVEGRERFTINVRYSRELRDEPEKLKRVLVPVAMNETARRGNGETAMVADSPSRRFADSTPQIPLGQLADIHITTGPPLIKNEDGALTGWVYVDVAGRDIGGYVKDAKRAVEQKILSAGLLPSGYRLEWTGQYEYMLRVKERLKVVVPLTLALIFVLLFMNFKSVPETLIILLSIPFAMTGSIWFLWMLNYNLSIAVWVGIIALAGLAAQTGTVMIIYLDEAFHAYQRAGRMKTQHDLFEAITYGAVQRVRPKLMTVCMITFGLVPALWAHGAGAEAIQRIAAPMVGGLITSTILTLEIVPAIYSLWRGRQVQWVKGPRPPRKRWSELSRQFVEMEREGHHDAVTAQAAASESRADAESGTPPVKRATGKWLWVLAGLVVLAGMAVWLANKSAVERTADATHATHATHAAKSAALPEKVELTESQAKATQTFITVAAAVSESLAADNLTDFNKAAAQSEPTIQELLSSLPAEHPWREPLQKISRGGKLVAAGDLAEARKEFLAFSVATAEFARVARQQADVLRAIKLYRCPMAPQPGFWIQTNGPLRNPYFGSEMLGCGNELKD